MRTAASPLPAPTLVLLALLVVLTGPLEAAAQRGGSSGSGAPPMRVNTPFEDFVEELRLDNKTQVPTVSNLMVEAAKGATPLVTELFEVRQQLLNLELGNRSSDKAPALQAHVLGATKMAAAEAATFAQVYALLRQNQQSRAPGAFAQMAGFFYPPANAGAAGRSAIGSVLGRLDVFTNLFTLDGDQKREIRGWFDEAHKGTAGARKGLADTRQAIVKAIQSGDQAAVDAAVAAYAVHATTMADAEMTVLARVIQRLTPEQRGNQRAISTAFALMRGFFVNDRRWDIIPDGKGY